MANPSTEELRCMLEPWLAHVRGRISATVDDFVQAEDVARDLWIDWRPLKEEKPDQKWCIMDVETMELLDLFARVDYRAAWGTILKELGLSLYLPQVLDTAHVQGHGRLYPRFRIKQLTELYARPRKFDRLTQQLIFETKPTAHTASFYAVRQAFLQCWTDLHNGGKGTTQLRKQSGRIAAMFDLDWGHVQERKFALSIMGCVSSLSALRDDPSRFDVLRQSKHSVMPKSTVFDVQGVQFRLSGPVVQDSTFRTIQEISGRYGMATRRVALTDTVHSLNEVSPVITTAFFGSMLLSLPHHTMPSEFHLGGGLCINVFKSAISGLQVNTSVHHLELVVSGIRAGFGGAAWPWIAYALFSAEAGHSVQHLGLDLTKLTNEDVDAFERALLAQDPLAAVPILPEKSTSAPSAARLARQPSAIEVARRTALLLNMGGNIQEIVAGEEALTFRVVENSPTSRYILCGVSRCWNLLGSPRRRPRRSNRMLAGAERD